MLIVGLTGSIGTGKSTAAAYIASLGVPVFDADEQVHRLYAGAAAGLIEDAFPRTTDGGIVDRGRLSAVLSAAPDGFARLEAIVHPLVRAAQRAFLATHHAAGSPMVLLDIPLLFETGGDALVDVRMVVSTDAATQRARTLSRSGMTADKFQSLIARQWSDAKKRAHADFVVDTTGPLADTRAQIDEVLARLKSRSATAFARCWA